MKNFSRKFLVCGILFLSSMQVIFAQSLLPESIRGLVDGWDSSSTVTGKISGFIRLGLTLAFGAVILVAVLYAILAAIKYIRSQGDAGQVEESNKAIKAIFQGVAAMFIGIIGVVIVFFIFDVALPDPNLPPVCVKYPETRACKVCSEGTKSSSSSLKCFRFDDGTSGCATEDACQDYDTPSQFGAI